MKWLGLKRKGDFVFSLKPADAASVEFHVYNGGKGRFLEKCMIWQLHNPEECIEKDTGNQGGKKNEHDPPFHVLMYGHDPDQSQEKMAAHHKGTSYGMHEPYLRYIAWYHHQKESNCSEVTQKFIGMRIGDRLLPAVITGKQVHGICAQKHARIKYNPGINILQT